MILIGSETGTSVQIDDGYFYMASFDLEGPEEQQIVESIERQLRRILEEEEEA